MTSAQGSKRRPELKPADFVEVALQIVVRDGLAELSMRRLGSELGVSPMALYKHFPDKEALISVLVDDVLGRVRLPPPPAPDDWKACIETIGVSTWRLLCQYPGIADELVIRAPAQMLPNASRIVTTTMQILRSAGFDDRTAEVGLDTLLSYLVGQVRLRGRLPKPMAPMADDDRFVAGLRTILRGLTADQPGATPPTQPRTKARRRP